jgi:DNA-binding Lrp family transcriptional regulator
MTADSLDRIDRAIVNAFQGGFPVVERPFDPAAAALRDRGVGITARELCDRIDALVDDGTLSRFGTLVDADALGGATTLVAMAVPGDRFEAVAETVNEHDEVAHNYERDHDLNMWFVLSVTDPDRIPVVLDAIERETGLETIDLPKRREFELEALFPVEGPLSDGGLDLSHLGPDGDASGGEGLRPHERDLIVAVQEGFPRTSTPYADLADAIGVSTERVLETTAGLLAGGTFRRVGVVPNHYALGYTENPMTVWDVPAEQLARVGRALASLPFVTHCYERPRREPDWPYNLFAMAHGRTPDAAAARVDRIRREVEDRCGPVTHDRIDSTRILEKTGLRLTERATANTVEDAP